MERPVRISQLPQETDPAGLQVVGITPQGETVRVPFEEAISSSNISDRVNALGETMYNDGGGCISREEAFQRYQPKGNYLTLRKLALPDYDAIAEKDANTLYMCGIDDTKGEPHICMVSVGDTELCRNAHFPKTILKGVAAVANPRIYGNNGAVKSIPTNTDKSFELDVRGIADRNINLYYTNDVFTEISAFPSYPYPSLEETFHLQQYMTHCQTADINTSKATSLRFMFQSCCNLTTLDVSGFDTRNVTNMAGMFYNCIRLKSIDGISGFDTSKVTTMESMFWKCVKLEAIDVSKFDTSNVTNMCNMFAFCKAVTTLDVSGFNTCNVTTMNNMLREMMSVAALDVSNFDTSNVRNMAWMFHYDVKLQTLDLSSFDVGKVTDMTRMFSLCGGLASLALGDWNMGKVAVTDLMFTGCSALTTVTGQISGLKVSLNLGSCPLTHDSAMVFVNGLEEVTSEQTLSLKAATYDTLTEEEIAIATSKGWTVASV